jgi:metallo-beta-lactamase family protein
MEDRGLISPVPVILDSPMAREATDVLLSLGEELQPQAFQAIKRREFFPRKFRLATTTDESMLACMQDGPLAIISASGMLSGGRILHHLKARLPDERNTILFTGYQAEGTKGRFLLDHHGEEPQLRIHHTEVPVVAAIKRLDGLSAHGDAADIEAWLKKAKKLPETIILNHGAGAAQAALGERLRATFPGIDVRCATEQSEFTWEI